MPKKVFKGKVTSDKMENSVVVTVDIPFRHPKYKKVIKKSKKFMAHDDLGVNIGDVVLIQESRPYSKYISFEVLEKVENGEEK